MKIFIRIGLLFLFLLTIGGITASFIHSESMARSVALESIGSLASPDLLERMPIEWVEMLLEVEDPSFYSHSGVDLRTPGQGWTTLTQGVVKRYFPGPLSGIWGKSRQSLFAWSLNRHLSKDQQLKVFLEAAYFGSYNGHDLVGFQNASSSIYGKDLLDLTRREYLGLVAMLVGPNHFHPVNHSKRVARIEALLEGLCEPSSWSDVYLEGCSGYE